MPMMQIFRKIMEDERSESCSLTPEELRSRIMCFQGSAALERRREPLERGSVIQSRYPKVLP